MNRETKRMMQRQGQVEADGSPSTRRATATQPSRRPPRSRASLPQFSREVRDEMRQVQWPNRAEMVNYTAVVITTLVIMIALIYVLNLAFAHFVLWLFRK